jgi:O-methyltransferase
MQGNRGCSGEKMSQLEVALRAAYLQILKRSLTDSLHQRSLVAILKEGGSVAVAEASQEDHRQRLDGRDWPAVAETMIGLKRLDNVQSCIETILNEAVPGDLIETGVWRGGAAIFMRGVLLAHGTTDRTVWAADSFAGLPVPKPAIYPADEGDIHHTISFLAASREEVEANFSRYGLLDGQVKFVEGWFCDTLPKLRGHRWALLRLDGDMYESTMEALVDLYDDLSPGGFVIIDDYGCLRACRTAVDEFREARRIREPLMEIDWTGRYWRKQVSPLPHTD